MLVATEQDEVDAGPRRTGPERRCIVTREVKPVNEMIRFVVGPEGAVVPDIRRRLPGRGVWVTASRAAVAAAVASRAFGRGFKRDVTAADLVVTTERLLERSALDALAIAHKAGLVAAGFAKAEAALAVQPVVGLIHAADGSAEGVRKLAASIRRRWGADGGPEVIDAFTSEQLDLALGRANVVHAAVLAGVASAGFLARYRGLDRFRCRVPAG